MIEPTPETTGNSRVPADAVAREAALNPETSFIVQAPAGSGKTALLIQRLLVLLARAERPEEVVAITFTRKAAAEMRARLLKALRRAAAQPDTPSHSEAPHSEGGAEDHEAALVRRARAVLERDRAKGWGLLDTPARLRILTFDAFCGQWVQAAPVRSGLGQHPGIHDQPEALYRQAAQATLADLERKNAPVESLGRLLLHLDNDMTRCERLLVNLLARRDQWLRHIRTDLPPQAWREALEVELEAVVREKLERMRAGLEGLLRDIEAQTGVEAARVLAEEARYAGAMVGHASAGSAIEALGDLDDLPPAHPAALPQWRGVAELLLTAKHQWRRTLTKGQGFPSDPALGDQKEQRAHKARMMEVLVALGDQSGDSATASDSVAEALGRATGFPEGGYPDAQWAVMEALLVVLPRAVAHLEDAFTREGGADYVAVAQAALRVLEEQVPERGGQQGAEVRTTGGSATGGWLEESRPRHLLVDEFQDTSRAQFEMLLELTRHWPTDGSHTLFLVGDPMQSIYRFREAEVGLFLRARQAGLGPLRLEPLILTENFRSRPGLVQWVNGVFPTLMAREEDAETGAVPFSPSTPHRIEKNRIPESGREEAVSGEDSDGDGAVWVHPLIQESSDAEQGRDGVNAEETAAVVWLIRDHLQDGESGTLAVLVRARSHLGAIVPALVGAGLPFRAVDIDALTDRQVTHDLLSLTRALLSTADRVAWLAVLRAPWCGLSLHDLHHLSGEGDGPSLWTRLRNAEKGSEFGPESQQRVSRLVAALAPSLAERGRRPLRRWVERAWLALGGPACLTPVEADHAARFFELLEGLTGAALPDLSLVEAGLARLFAAPDPGADGRVQVMSIHKSKGLEFDTVILPGLGKRSRGEDNPLLRWFERPLPSPGGNGLLLAPIQATGEGHDPIYALLADMEKDKAHHELGRLLYVAATRAREQLHLLGHGTLKEAGLRAPGQGTLLGILWPKVEADFEDALAVREDDAGTGGGGENTLPGESAEKSAAPLRRLPADWMAPEAPRGVETPGKAVGTEEPAPLPQRAFDWAGETARHVGTVTHRLLCQLAAGEGGRPPRPPEHWNEKAVAAALTRAGVAPERLEDAGARVRRAVEASLTEPRGQWILSPHAQAQVEFEVTVVREGRPRHFIIDRTFVDEEGVRWIVDYKTGFREGGNVEAFLDNEVERYRDQLEGYAEAMGQLDPGRPIRLGLYFPLHAGWREWAPGQGESAGEPA